MAKSYSLHGVLIPQKDGGGGRVANFDVMGGPVKLAFQCGAIPYGGTYKIKLSFLI